ncbi:MBL fold metallo-hydrolase [Aliikangiella marina]|uniref:MBL fold metallo-hydrolase n=1 Tax=Aliikangiella marina TaxID=1712262 RepID=A0A545T167_9GAMM|nr:MBL fold metallo-hydrolase [Aliikangiella marina]TQV70966.1 MBL fold metallo-hydrolase [Aliikangiella marina]
MNKITKYLVLSSLLSMSFGAIAEDKPKLKFKATELTKGIYMLEGENGFAGGNIGLSIGEDGVVMIDDAMPSTLNIMQEAISGVTKKPIDFLINTHVHGDHIGNNEVMAKNGAHIVAHENLRTHLLTKGIRGQEGTKPAPKGMLPVITFSHEMSFHLNGEDAQLIHVADAHTDGDAVIVFKNANIIHMGDTFFNGRFPFIDLDSGGTIDGYIKAQERVLSLSNEKTKIIPGHGPLASKQDLEQSIAMLKDVKSIIGKLIADGKSEDDVVKMNPLNKYAKQNWGFITTERMTRQVYKGLK